MLVLLRFVIGTALGFLERMVGAFVLCKVWMWWVIPLWPTAPSLTFLRSLGVGLVISTLWLPSSLAQARVLKKLTPDNNEDEWEWEDIMWSAATIGLVWPLTLGIAWVLQWGLL